MKINNFTQKIKKDLLQKKKAVIRGIGTVKVNKRKASPIFKDKEEQKFLSIKASKPLLKELNGK